MTTLETLTLMYRDLIDINRATGLVATLVLCDIADDVNAIADGLVWGS